MGFKFDRAAMHHSSFLSGADVMCAGTLEVIEGKLIYISNNSGHYKPNIDDLQAVCNAILIDYALQRSATPCLRISMPRNILL